MFPRRDEEWRLFLRRAFLDSIVIAFWIGLAAFVAFLFFILFYISQTGYTSIKNRRQRKMFPWNYSKNNHQDVITSHAVPTLAGNQVEETEGSRISHGRNCGERMF